MISSMTWERAVLSPALLHSVSSVVSCCYVTGHYSSAWRMVHSIGAMLQLHCSYLSDGAACLELLNHSIL
jgi:hypothetical protein